jgi:hypothetical protein
MSLTWHLLEARLPDQSPWVAPLGHQGVCALTVSVRDPDQPRRWRACSYGEQPMKGNGFHADYEEGPNGDQIILHFDSRLRQETVRVAFAVLKRS